MTLEKSNAKAVTVSTSRFAPVAPAPERRFALFATEAEDEHVQLAAVPVSPCDILTIRTTKCNTCHAAVAAVAAVWDALQG